MVIKGQLIASENDLLGYQTLVFKNLELNPPFGCSYVMLTVFPNWQSSIPDINDIGYLEYKETTAGEDYYNRKTDSIDKYNFSNLVFIKFIKEKHIDNSKKNIII